MFIYTTSFETISAYSTARKAIESEIGSGFADMTDYGSIPPGADYDQCWVEVTAENVPKIIAWVNKRGSVDIVHCDPRREDTCNVDRTEINKVRVR